MFRTPHRDSGERLTIGEVDPTHLKHATRPENLRHSRWRVDEGEIDDPSLGHNSRLSKLLLYRVQLANRLVQRFAGHIPAKSLTRSNETVVA